MFKSKRFVRAALVVLATTAVFATAACSSATPAATSSAKASGGSVTVAMSQGDFGSLDPVIDSSLQGINAYDALYDTLTEVKRDGSVGPRLATKWVPNDDATQWDFTIRKDAKFTDGTPVTIEDIMYTFNQVKTNPKSLNTRYLSLLSSMEKVGDNVLRFHMSAPFAIWPRQMTLLSIVPQKYYESAGGSVGYAKAPIGSGPYKFVSYTPGVSLVVEKNADYWGKSGPDKPTLDKITFVPVTDDQARVSGVQSGSLDVALIPPTQVTTVKGTGTVDVKSVDGNQTVYLGFNTAVKPLDDPNIRKAISLAVDRDAIVKTVLGGLAKTATQMSAPINFGYDSSLKPLKYNVTEAKKLIKDAGYDGTPIPLQYALNGFVPLGAQVAQAVAGYLEKAGLKIDLQGMDSASYSLVGANKAYKGIFFSGWGPSYLDAQIFLGGLAPTGTRYFQDPASDALYAKQVSDADPKERLKDINKIWGLINDKTYYAALYYPKFNYAVSKKVNWDPYAQGAMFFEGTTVSK
jgi:peptide/nickel transport system substrate-binding protein